MDDVSQTAVVSGNVDARLEKGLGKIVLAASVNGESLLLGNLQRDFQLSQETENFNGDLSYQLNDQFHEIDLVNMHPRYPSTLYGSQKEGIEAVVKGKKEAVRLTIRPYHLAIDYSGIERFCQAMMNKNISYILYVVPAGINPPRPSI